MSRLVLVFIVSLLFAFSAAAQSGLRLGSPAPLFSGMSVSGKQYDLNELRGKVVVITFWSSKCPICHTELPKLNSIAAQYDSNKVVFLALTMESEDKVANYLQRNSFRFEVLPNSLGTVLRYADRNRSGDLDMGFPSFFLVDQQGLVQFRSSGYDKTGDLKNAIAKLLAK